jgi:hypothetical protein
VPTAEVARVQLQVEGPTHLERRHRGAAALDPGPSGRPTGPSEGEEAPDLTLESVS